MNKSEFCKVIAAELNSSEAEVRRLLDVIGKGIVNGLKRDGRVTFIGFLTFMLTQRKSEFIKPGTQIKVKTKYPKAIRVKIGKKLKEEMNSAETSQQKNKK